MYKIILDNIKPELDKAIHHFEGELAKIRSGRASTSLVEDVKVDCFGERFPLKQLASISLPEPRQIVIHPWDKSYIEPIEKAILVSGLGVSSAVDREVIRISLPPLSEEFRKNLLRLLSERQEESRKTLRRWREDAWAKIQQGFKDGEISEDDKFRAKEELEKLVKDYQDKIDELGERKKKDIME